MSRLFGLIVLSLVVGCGEAPTSDVSTDAATETAVGGSDATGSDSKGSGSAAKTTAVVFNLAGAPVVEFEAPKMHCEACEANVRKALLAEVGVLDVKADAESGLVQVAVDESTFETDTAIQAIADAGFGEALLRE